MPAALASVPFGFVLVRVRVRVLRIERLNSENCSLVLDVQCLRNITELDSNEKGKVPIKENGSSMPFGCLAREM